MATIVFVNPTNDDLTRYCGSTVIVWSAGQYLATGTLTVVRGEFNVDVFAFVREHVSLIRKVPLAPLQIYLRRRLIPYTATYSELFPPKKEQEEE